jgi:predicted dehydrogenase
MALKDMNRREFLAPAAAGLAFTIVPRHVLGGQGHVAPSDKLNLAYIGCGTQGTREMLPLLANADVHITAVCDPVKDGEFYIDWDKTGIRDRIRTTLGNPTWGANIKGIRGGRDMFKEIITTYYAQKRGTETYKGCNTYADFRELLAQEKDVDAVKIMTPDHHHARIAVAAMRAGKHVAVHKPLSNRVSEVRLIVDTVKKTGKQTHLLAYQGRPVTAVADMVKDGAIGTLREIHNWTDRPFWPQQLQLPKDRPPVPDGLDWNLWLGGSLDRPYSPVYTFAVFRGWYEFGGGSIADMGNYSLWPIFTAFDLPVPYSIEAQGSSSCEINDGVSTITANDFAYPYANRIKFKIAAHGNWPAIDLYWYDGGMRPFTIPELEEDKRSMPATGSMFVGDKGVILDNAIVPASKNAAYRAAKGLPAATAGRGGRGGGGGGGEGGATGLWVNAFKGGPASPGNFLNAANCAETIALAGAAMRISRKNFGENKAVPALLWDAASMKFTNNPEANQYLVREYRKGWELA